MNIASIMKIIFYILTIQAIVSILCTIFLFSQYILNREIRQKKNNHILFILLCVTFIQSTTELPLALIFIYTGHSAHSSSSFCIFWILCTCSLDTTGLLLMAFASFERYLFIFHCMFLKKHSIILRYIPISLCFIYPFFYYISMNFFLTCTQNFIYSAFLCGGGCYIYNRLWNAITWIAHICTPIFFILVFNIFLIIRTLYQKNRMQQRNVWIKNRKMLLQLVSIALLYCIAWLPSAILMLIVTFPPPNVDVARIFIIFQYIIFMTPSIPLFYPYVCLFGQPEIVKKLKRTFQRQDTVVPL